MRFVTLRQHPEWTTEVVRKYRGRFDAQWLLSRPLYVMLAVEGALLHGCLVVVTSHTSERPRRFNPWMTQIVCHDADVRDRLVSAAIRHHRGLGKLPGKPDPPRMDLFFYCASGRPPVPEEWRPVVGGTFALR